MSGILGEMTNSREGGYRLHQRYHTGAAIQSGEASSKVTAHITGSQTTDLYNSNTAQNGLEMVIKTKNPILSVKVTSSGIGHDGGGNSDSYDKGIRVRWGITTGGMTNDFGMSHDHRFDGTATNMWGTDINYMSTDGSIAVSPTSTWYSEPFSYEHAEQITINPGDPIYFRISLSSATANIFWNRSEASPTSQSCHSWYQVNEYKSST